MTSGLAFISRADDPGVRRMLRLICTLTVLACLTQQSVAGSRPNLIVVLIDDMGFSDLGCFGGENSATPIIDQLAAEGLRFRNFYVSSPICSPSRTAFTTGLYPHRKRITSYLDNRRRNAERGVANWLDPSTPTLARLLQDGGYATGHFGKWHLGGQRDVHDAPLITEYGFDESLTSFEGLGPRVLHLNSTWDGNPSRKYDLGSAALGRGPIRWADRSTITSEFVHAALGFIDQSRSAGQPFYINVWPDDVHSPFFPAEELRKATDGSKRQLYQAVLTAMDRQLRPLFDRIRDDDTLRDNTVIVLASDNGHEQGAGRSDPLRGGKTWLYEGGIRSPLIVWAPGLMNSSVIGTVNDTSVLSAMDLCRSLASISGTAVPPEALSDGEDLAAAFLGSSQTGRQAPLFWRRPPDRPGTSTQDNPDLAVRQGNWKLLINYDGGDRQLYDLVTDVSESHNVADDHQEVADRLTQLVFEWNSTMPADAGEPERRNPMN